MGLSAYQKSVTVIGGRGAGGPGGRGAGGPGGWGAGGQGGRGAGGQGGRGEKGQGGANPLIRYNPLLSCGIIRE